MKTLWRILVSMRPKQWTKNLVLFAGVVFSERFLEPTLVKKSFAGFLVFCVLSGGVYILNDLIDRRRDEEHPSKRTRPISSGALGPATAGIAAALLFGGGFVAAAAAGREFLLFAAAFAIVNAAYSLRLREMVIIDVIAISFSFLIRAGAGVAVLHADVPGLEFSAWLWICTLFLSLFLAICKRRNEFCALESAGRHRRVLDDYSVRLLDQLVGIAGTSTVVSYSIYTVWPSTVDKFGTSGLVYTIPFVVFGVMRYLYLVYNRQEGGDPSGVLLTEPGIMIDVFLWFVTVLLILMLS